MPITVQCTEFDNSRHEYLEHEARGVDYLPILRQELDEQCAYYAQHSTLAELKSLRQECELLMLELQSWAQSARSDADRKFVCDVRHQVQQQLADLGVPVLNAEHIHVYLAGDDRACLTLGGQDSDVRLIYMRQDFGECVRQAVCQYAEQQRHRQQERLAPLLVMQQTLAGIRSSEVELDPARILRCVVSPLLGATSNYLTALIRRAAGQSARIPRCYSPEVDARYLDFIGSLAHVAAPLIMMGNGQTVYYAFQISIPSEGQMQVSWDPIGSRSYLYSHVFDVSQSWADELRLWFASSCLSEVKRLKDMELAIRASTL